MAAIHSLGARRAQRVSYDIMPALITYFKSHPWQRRLLTISIALVLSVSAVLLLLPWIRDMKIISAMDSPKSAVREAAVSAAVLRSRKHPAIIDRMAAALHGSSDRKFLSLVRGLRILGQFDTPDRDPALLDRIRTYEVAHNPSLKARRLFFIEILADGRDNRHVRAALASATADPNADVRVLAGMLAARLGDGDGDAALGKLLGDADPNVVEAAAIDIGLTRRTALTGKITSLLDDANDIRPTSGAAFALAALDANTAAKKLPALLTAARDANDEALCDRLLEVMGSMDDDASAKAILDAVGLTDKPSQYPRAAALLAVARRKLPAAAPAVRRVLESATAKPDGLLVRQVHAAILAADALNLPVRKPVHDICSKLWTWRPGYRLMLTDATKLLGDQAAAPQGSEPNEPTTDECIRTLRQAAIARWEPATAPAAQARPRHTPLPSAAAAAALWKLRAKDAKEFVLLRAANRISLSGEYLAWNIGTSGRDDSFELGLSLLPALNDPNNRVYNDDARSTGAMLLAISAATPQARSRATERIRSRLVGGQRGGEDSFHVRGTFRCALAILGDPNAPADVLTLLETTHFSYRRAITALTLAGDFRGMDWLLWHPQICREDMLLLLVDDQISDVISRCLDPMPTVSPAAGTDLARWQLLILRRAYAIRRPTLKPRLIRGPE